MKRSLFAVTALAGAAALVCSAWLRPTEAPSAPTAAPPPTAASAQAPEQPAQAERRGYPTLAEAIAAARYAIWQADGNRPSASEETSVTLHAGNPTHGFKAAFERERVAVQPQVFSHGKPWHLGLRMAGWGRGDHVRPPTPTRRRVVDGCRIRYERGDTTEWYENKPAGLEQGFTVRARPEGDASQPLCVELAIEGGLTPRLNDDASAIHFSRNGAEVVRYDKLLAFDNQGRHLPARMALQGNRVRLLVDDADAAYPVVIDPLIAVRFDVRRASDAGVNDRFGHAVALDGNTAVVGSPGDESETGAVYVFEQSGSLGWIQKAKLMARQTDRDEGDQFGSSVAIDGDTVAIGAMLDDDAGSASGSVFIFRRDVTGWAQEAKIVGHNAEDNFGFSVSLDGDRLAVGARRDDQLGSEAGAAYVYERTGLQWTQVAKLLAEDGQPTDYFGWSVSVEGTTVVVGAPQVDEGGMLDVGGAYVYTPVAGVWTQRAKLYPTDMAENARFGWAVAASGERLVVGAPYVDGDAGGATLSEAGQVYIFEGAADTWTAMASRTASEPAAYEHVGWSVDIDGDHVIVGSNRTSGGVGSAYMYLYTPSTEMWSEPSRVIGPDVVASDGFGRSVTVDGDVFIVGAPFDDASDLEDEAFDNNAGCVYLFTLSDSQEGSDTVAGDLLGWSIGMDGDTVVAGAPGVDDGMGAAYIFRRSDGLWREEAQLLPTQRQTGARFGWSVDVSGDSAIVGAYLDNTVGLNSGTAYIFVRKTIDGKTVWQQQIKLNAEDCTAGRVSFMDDVIDPDLDPDNPDVGSIVGIDDAHGLTLEFEFMAAVDFESWMNVLDRNPADGVLTPAEFADWTAAQFYDEDDNDVLSEAEARAFFASRMDTTPTLGRVGVDLAYIRNSGTGLLEPELDPLTGDPVIDPDTGDPAWAPDAAETMDNLVRAVNDTNLLVYATTVDWHIPTALVQHDNRNVAGSAATMYANDPAHVHVDGNFGQNDNFGAAVAIFGDWAIIGQPNDDDHSTDGGAAYVYRRQGVWEPFAKVNAGLDHAQPVAQFGRSVDICKNLGRSFSRFVVGAPEHDVGEYSNAGAAFVFETTINMSDPHGTTVPVMSPMLTAPEPAGGDAFGHAVKISGDRVMVGAPFRDVKVDNGGSVVPFERKSFTTYVEYQPREEIFPNDPEVDQHFGRSVDVVGTLTVVGAPGDSDSGTRAGASYVFAGGVASRQVVLDDSADQWVNPTRPLEQPDPGFLGDPTVQVADADGDYIIFEYVSDNEPGQTEIPAGSGNMITNTPVPLGLDGRQSLVNLVQAINQSGLDVVAYNVTTDINWPKAMIYSLHPGETGNGASAYAASSLIAADGEFLGGGTETWAQFFKLTAFPSAQFDEYGWAVGASGGWACIGAPYSDPSAAAEAGSVFFRPIEVPGGVLQFSRTNYAVEEDAGQVVLTVNRLHGSNGDLTVEYRTSDASAFHQPYPGRPNDYTQSIGLLNFAEGEMTKTITIPIVDDSIAEGTLMFGVELRNPGGGCILGSEMAMVRILDNEPNVLSRPQTVITQESGSKDFFRVVLSSNPKADVRVLLTMDDTSEGRISANKEGPYNVDLELFFDRQDWDLPQRVWVMGRDDAIDDDDQTYHILIQTQADPGNSYADMMYPEIPWVTVHNLDDDDAGVVVQAEDEGLETREEGTTDVFSILLNSQPEPSQVVTITVSSSDPSEFLVGQDTAAFASTTNVVFTASNWNMPYPVYVQGQDDFMIDGPITDDVVCYVNTALTTAVEYHGQPVDDVSCTNLDNDLPTVHVDPTIYVQQDDTLVTTEGGGSATFRVWLGANPATDTMPNGQVVVDLRILSPHDTEGAFNNPLALDETDTRSQLIFTSTNWSTPQDVVVYGVDDYEYDGPVTWRVEVTLDVEATIDVEETTSPHFRDNDPTTVGLQPTNPQDVTLLNEDNEAGLLVTWPDELLTDEAEGDVADPQDLRADTSFTVVLVSDPFTIASDPNELVTVTVESQDTTEGLLAKDAGGGALSWNSSIVLTFNTSNWNVPQTVWLTGVNDYVVDGTVPYTVELNATSTNMAVYDVEVVEPENVDDDRAFINVTEPEGGIVTYEGTSGPQVSSFTVVLESDPEGVVTVPLQSRDISEGLLSLDQSTWSQNVTVAFSPTDPSRKWNVPQTVYVQGQDDALDDGDITYTVRVGAATGQLYTGFDVPDLTATNIDDDESIVEVELLGSGTVIETDEKGLLVAEFRVRLAADPGGTVEVKVQSQDISEALVAVDSNAGPFQMSQLLTFDSTITSAQRWDVWQSVWVRGVDDTEVDGNVRYTVVLPPVKNSGTSFDGVDPPDVVGINEDDEAGVRVKPVTGLVTHENDVTMGAYEAFEIEFIADPGRYDPTATIEVRIRSRDTSEALISTSPNGPWVTEMALVVGTHNWQNNWTILVQGQDDYLDDGDTTFKIELPAIQAAGNDYDGINPADVYVTNMDDDPNDIDTDGDGLTDYDEFNTYLTNPLNPDTDGDGMWDGWEIENGLRPLDPSDSILDPDNDYLINVDEFRNDTDPNNADTDGDDMPDGWEVEHRADDTINTPQRPDPLVVDAADDLDGDGYVNIEEYNAGTDPWDAFDHPNPSTSVGGSGSAADDEEWYECGAPQDGGAGSALPLILLGILAAWRLRRRQVTVPQQQ